MMLQTLVENAIKHGLEPVPGGGTIWVLAREADGKVAITVADDGRGFSEDGGGTGIGLKNVRERLKLAYRRRGVLRHRREFPEGRGGHDHVPSTHEVRRRRRRSPAARRARRAAREGVARARDRRGVRGRRLRAGGDRELQPEVAFLDIRMPGLTGLEVAPPPPRRARARTWSFVTAYDQYAIDAFERGAVDYLLKPSTPERLAATVEAREGAPRGAGRPRALAAIIDQLRAKLPAAPKGRRCSGSPRASARRRASSWSRTSPTSGGQQVHGGDDGGGRGAHPQAHPRAPRRASTRRCSSRSTAPPS
jgi:CheY-like chemotaxis protein